MNILVSLRFLCGLTLALTALLLPLDTFARSEAQLRACLRAKLPNRSFQQDVVIRQSSPDGETRRLAGTWYWRSQGAVQSGAIRLSAPADLRGAAYLFVQKKVDPDFYMYLPSLRKSRHVVGATMAQSLFGSGLSAFDLKFLISGTQGGQLRSLGLATLDGRPVENWRYTPPSDPEILYDRVDLSIDRDRCLPMAAQLFGGVPWKTLSVDAASVVQIEGRWIAQRMTLTDTRANTTSLIELGRERIDVDLPDWQFQPDGYYR